MSITDFKDAEEKWAAIGSMLEKAHSIGFHTDWRRRYGNSEDEIDNAEQHARALWFGAKTLYLNNKDEIDGFAKGNQVNAHYHSLYLAMVKTIEKEMQEQLEKQILGDDMSKKKYEELEGFEDQIEIDEDEAYVLETEQEYEDSDDEETAEWDGDEYLGDEDDQEEGY